MSKQRLLNTFINERGKCTRYDIYETNKEQEYPHHLIITYFLGNKHMYVYFNLPGVNMIKATNYHYYETDELCIIECIVKHDIIYKVCIKFSNKNYINTESTADLYGEMIINENKKEHIILLEKVDTTSHTIKDTSNTYLSFNNMSSA